MATATTVRPTESATLPVSTSEARFDNPAYQAFWLLRIGFTVAPILFGLDKFAHVLVNWDRYLAPWIDRIVPGTAHQASAAVTTTQHRPGSGASRAWIAVVRSPAMIPSTTDRFMPQTSSA